MKRLKIYVAGPYSGIDAHAVTQNTYRAMAAGIEIMKKGHHPYIPHLTHFLCTSPTCPWSSSDRRWVELDEPWVLACDALLYLAPSRGADYELAKAKENGLTIFIRTEDIPEASEGPFTGEGK